MALTLSIVSILFGYQIYKRSMEEHFIALGDNLAKTAANLIDGDKIDYYLETGIKDAEYERTLELMRMLKRDNDILYLYVVKPTPTGTYYIYDTDESEERCDLGDFEEWYDDFREASKKFLAGQDIDPIISDESFGWLLSVYQPVRGSDQTVKGYVGADFSMESFMADRRRFLLQLITLTSLITLIFTFVYLFVIRKTIISPINRMAKAADEFLVDHPSGGDHESNSSSIADLYVDTRDELESLADSLKSMEKKINEYIHNLDVATRKAETDVLTGLSNRDSFQKSVDAYLRFEMSDDQFNAFMMVDIDYFKQINDTYGHIVGDEVLKHCAQTLREVFRSSDLIARLGGDEFAVFCKGVGTAEAVEEKAHQIQTRWKGIHPKSVSEMQREITASIGISFAPNDGSTYLDLYQKADIALYQAKDQGRDRFVHYLD